ncbi:MAG: CHAT domain-containing protein [Oscillatoriaceae cyanobacterium Prado104]|jgi:CHAT domain-containing protein|nr:CHAT domain-containing protein [Oscillatoriaceae cyanobacterium Prado104]
MTRKKKVNTSKILKHWLRESQLAAIKKLLDRPYVIAVVFVFILSNLLPAAISVTAQIPSDRVATNPVYLIQEAQRFYEQRQFDRSATIWQQAAAAFAVKKDVLNQAMALSNLSLTYQQFGQWEGAKSAIAESFNLLDRLANSSDRQRILAQTLEIQGRLQRESGDSERAIETWQKAANIYTQIGQQKNAVIQNQINQSQALQDLGLYPRACKSLLKAFAVDIQDCKTLTELPAATSSQKLAAITNLSDSLLKFDGLHNLGNVLRAIGDLQLSENILELSLKVAQNLRSPLEISTAMLSSGNTARAFADRQILLPPQDRDLTILILKTQAALNFYRQAAQLSPSPTTKLQGQLNQLSLLLESQPWLGDRELINSAGLWRSIQTEINNLPASRSGIYAQINLAKIYLKMRTKAANAARLPLQLPTAIEINNILTKAAEQAKILGDRKAEAYAVGSLGTLYETAKEWQPAESLTKQALSLVSAEKAADITYQYFWQLGRIYKARSDIEKTVGNIDRAEKDIEAALAAYTNAFENLRSLRSDLVAINPEVQFSFRDSVEPVYRQLVALNLQVAKSLIGKGKIEDSQKFLKQARNAIESLQIAELNNFFQDTCVDVKNQQIDEVDRTAAIIYPIILEQQLEVIVRLPGGKLLLYAPSDSQTSQAITQKELENTLKELRVGEKNASLQSPASGNNFLPLTQRVYDWLIRPIETALESSQAKTLVFVLDGELRNIPMSVLHDGKRYLVEKYAIALTPGLQLLNPQPLSQAQLRALIAGATNAPSFQANNLNPLPAVEKELNEIAETLPNNDKRENENFTKANLQAIIDRVPFPVVHIATHGQFSSNAEQTFILDWNGQINVRDLDGLLRVADRKRPIELLVLSACETVAGDSRAALGLAGVAVRAGARSTLATLWQINDESTAIFMSEFYSELAKSDRSVNKAEALRRAQVKLLQDSKYQHPYFWAPYVLVGNWQ